MKKPTTILAAAAVLSGAGSATAQVYEHVPGSIGLTASHHAGYGHGVGSGLVRPATGIAWSAGGGLSFGFGFGVHGYAHGGYLYNAYPFALRPGPHCWEYLWFDPFLDCGPYYRHGWFDPWWEPVVFVPSPRFHFGWFSHGWHSPYWRDPWYTRWTYGGWDPYWSHVGYRTVHYDRGYVHDRGYAQRRVASRSPLFGPRYKEDPRPYVYVTDNGPERPVSRAVPRGDRTARPSNTIDGVQPAAGRRGGAVRTEPATRTARPRVRARPETGQDASPPTSARPRTRSGGLVVTPGSPVRTSRPDTRREDPGTASRPTSSRPTVVTPTPPRSTGPRIGRATPPTGRAIPPTVRTRPDAAPPRRVITSRPSQPAKARPAPSRTRVTPPRAAPAPARVRSAPPKASSAPPRRSPPKASSAPPRRSPPKASSAPPRRSPPKSSPPKRSAPARRK